MRAITIRTNADKLLRFPLPKGVNGHLCIRALRALNRGDDYLGLTSAESDFVADVVAQIEAENEAQALPVPAESKG